MTKLLILITGMPGSGKSVVADVFRKKGVRIVSMGDIVRDLLKKEHEKGSRISLTDFSVKLRERHGEDIIAKLTSKAIEQYPDKIIVVDGVRSLVEVEVFREKYDVKIFAVHAPPQERFKRLRERKRRDDPKTFEEFKHRDLNELALGVGNVIALADIMIVNYKKSLTEFIQEIENVLKEEVGI